MADASSTWASLGASTAKCARGILAARRGSSPGSRESGRTSRRRSIAASPHPGPHLGGAPAQGEISRSVTRGGVVPRRSGGRGSAARRSPCVARVRDRAPNDRAPKVGTMSLRAVCTAQARPIAVTTAPAHHCRHMSVMSSELGVVCSRAAVRCARRSRFPSEPLARAPTHARLAPDGDGHGAPQCPGLTRRADGPGRLGISRSILAISAAASRRA